LKRIIHPAAWDGPQPLPNPLDVARLGEIYSRTAAFYDGLVAEHQARAKLEALNQLNRQPGERFLEVGVGTAWAFQHLIAESGAQDAYGLDVSLGMLQVARQRLALPADKIPSPSRERVKRPNQHLGDERHYPPTKPRPSGPDSSPKPHPPGLDHATCPLLLADARHLPFPDASFDCLLNTYTFEVLATPDIPTMLDECLRILRPGGRIAIVNLTEGQGTDAAMIEDWKRRYANDPEFFGGARPLELQPLLQTRGLTVTRTYVGPEWPSEVLLTQRPA
jgi:ubiquinone/menaquinone biosynthesis C-methylase UbiE